MIVRITKPFFSAPAGSTLKQIPDSRLKTPCDVCGCDKNCDFYEWDPPIEGMPGMDICPSCGRKLKVTE